MNIKSAKYVKDVDGNNYAINIVVNDKTICVPPDPNNTDYAAILEWVADGNTIQEAD
jgi:hypothetical protein